MASKSVMELETPGRNSLSSWGSRIREGGDGYHYRILRRVKLPAEGCRAGGRAEARIRPRDAPDQGRWRDLRRPGRRRSRVFEVQGGPVSGSWGGGGDRATDHEEIGRIVLLQIDRAQRPSPRVHSVHRSPSPYPTPSLGMKRRVGHYPALLTGVRREGAEVPCPVEFSTRGARRRT